MTFDQIREDFSYLGEWEDRYRYLIELGNKLEPLAEEHRTATTKVHGCASQVWLWSAPTDDSDRSMRFVADSDAHIVRGLIAVLLALYNGKSAEEILAIDAAAELADLGLDEHLSTQRSNGVRAMIKRIRDDARKELAQADH